MRILILIILLTISALKLFAQDVCECSSILVLKATDEKLFGTVVGRSPDSRQFYTAEWNKGSVLLTNGKTVTDEILKYNGFLNKFFVYKPVTGQLVIVDDEEIMEVSLDDPGRSETKHFVKKRVKELYTADSADTYLEVLTAGPATLYAWRKMEYFPASNDYKPDMRYYVSMSGKGVNQVEPRNKNFLILTGEMEEILKTRFRKEGLNIKREEDFIQAVNLYNELFETGSEHEK